MNKPNRAMRRAVLAGKADLPVLQDSDLTTLAFAKLNERMAHYGNVLTDTHRKALYCVLGRFTHLANGFMPGRWGYALPCGAGKTEAAKAWCWALWKLRKPYSVAISAAKVEALCDLKRGLIELGVPEDAIGLIHSYKFEPKHREAGQEQPNGTASLPPTDDNQHRPIVLLTHNKLRGRFGDQIPLYNGLSRSLLIYDESLLISDAWHLTKTEINQALGHLGPIIEDRKSAPTELRAAHSYCVEARDRIVAELDAQKADPRRPPSQIILDPLTVEKQDAYLRALYHDRWADLRRLVKFAQQPMRAVPSNDGGGTIWYELRIPNDLQSVCVLDASMVIRHLPKIGGRIQEDPAFAALGDVKGNRNVRVHQLYWHSGRYSMTKAFNEKREGRLVSKEVIEVVKGIPEGEGVIIWSFKHRGPKEPNIPDLIRGDLAAAGIDVNATVSTPEGPKARFAFLTWGNETSTNDYAYCRNVIMAGVLHRDRLDLAAALVGQHDDLLGDVSQVNEIKRSEIAHCVYQALSRGSCRTTKEGQASPMKAWIIHPDAALEDAIRTAMPGIQWSEWTPRFLKGVGGQKTRSTAKAIAEYLDRLPEEVVKVSGKALKAAVGPDASKDVWKGAIKVAEEELTSWRRDDRSFSRVV